MDREQTKEYLAWFERNKPAMEAFARGDDVDVSASPDEWCTAFNPSWHAAFEYRPKPKIKKVKLYAVLSKFSGNMQWSTRSDWDTDDYKRIPSLDKEVEIEE